MVASRAVVTTRVNNIEMAVLMATIWPNFEKGIIVQKNSGTVEITVVIALDTMATPTWLTASSVRRWRSVDGSCEAEVQVKGAQLTKAV